MALRWVSAAGLLLAAILLGWLVLPGLGWGLPSAERNRLTLGEDRKAWHAPAVPSGEGRDPWTFYPNFLQGGAPRTGSQPRSAFNPVRSYHPDEYVFFKSLSGMRPGRLDLFHGFFGWPALQFYVVGAALKGASLVGAAVLVPDLEYYFQNPEAMARLYEIGRGVTFLFAVGCLVVVWRAGRRLFGPAGGAAAALLLAVTPLFTINARYLTADVPMLFWLALVLLFSTHILAGGGRRWYALAGVALGLAAATRYQGALGAFLILAAHAGRAPGGGWLRSIPKMATARNLWIAAGVSVAVFLACNPYILVRPGQFMQEFAGEMRGARLPVQAFLLQGLLFAETGFGLMMLIATGGALALLAARRDRNALFVLIGFGVPGALLLLGRPGMARYLLPALLLPVLLMAWAFAVMCEQGLARRKAGARYVLPGLLAFVLLVTLVQASAFAALYIYPSFDTRTRAGDWISRSVPAGATVGVLSEPWQFELPPLDAQKYRLVILSGGAADPRPDYLVLSDLQLGLRAPEEWMARFDPRYAVVEQFESWPLGQRAFLALGPHDLRYADPRIVVAKRGER